MKKTNCLVSALIFILSILISKAQNGGNFTLATVRQPSFEGHTFSSPVYLPKWASASAVIVPGNCQKQITVSTPEGTILCDFLNESKATEVTKTGKDDCGAWSPWAYGDCVGIFRSRYRVRNCSRTDVLQEKHECNYVPNIAWFGWVGTATSTHSHGDPYNKTHNWTEEEDDTELCFFSSLSPDLSNGLATVASGKELRVTYSGEKASLMKGTSLVMTEDWRIVWGKNIPSQIASVTYTVDGRDVAPGQKVSMNDAGEHSVLVNISTKSGGLVKFSIPFAVIRPITIEEITQETLTNGATQFDIKIMNNNKLHPGAAWVSTAGLSSPGYIAEITGPKEYDFKEGNSALVSVILRPSGIRKINPGNPEDPVSFDFIVSHPGANGLVMDKKTIAAQTAPTTSPGGSAGIDGPQMVRTISVSTLSGEVVDVKVPNNIRPGDHISGSIVPRTASSTLQGAVVDVESNKSDAKDKLFKFLVPAGLASIPLIIRDNNGTELARTSIPVNLPNLPTPGNNVTVPLQHIETPLQHPPGNFAPINYCQPGRPLTINGFFDGDAANTNVSINNIACEVIAESDRGSFVFVPANLPPGKASLAIEEGGVRGQFDIQVVITELTSNKTVVQKNTKATVTATVSGLENLDLNSNNFKIELTNASPGVIQFKEATTTTLTRTINSSNTNNGTFRFTTDITGTATGPYTITSTLSSTTCTDCWKQYQACIAKAEADEKQCYKDCDKANAGINCYLACSAAARVQEAECFAEYLGCVRKKMGF